MVCFVSPNRAKAGSEDAGEGRRRQRGCLRPHARSPASKRRTEVEVRQEVDGDAAMPWFLRYLSSSPFSPQGFIHPCISRSKPLTPTPSKQLHPPAPPALRSNRRALTPNNAAARIAIPSHHVPPTQHSLWPTR